MKEGCEQPEGGPVLDARDLFSRRSGALQVVKDEAHTHLSHSEQDDAGLVEAALSGHEVAFRAIVDRYMPVVAGFFYGRTRDAVETEELIQEVFVAAYRHLPRLRARDRLGPWLIAISRNKLRDWQRSRRTARRYFDHTAEGADAHDPAPTPGEEASRSDLAREVAEAIGRLHETYRVVLYMRFQEDRPLNEVAARLALKESTVRMRLLRGLEKVRADLRKRGIGIEG